MGCATQRLVACSSTPSTRRDAGIWGLNHCFVALLKVAAFVSGVRIFFTATSSTHFTRRILAKDKEQLKKL